MSAHTPGPWKANTHRDGSRIEAGGRSVAWVGADDTREVSGRIVEVMSAEGRANARLIAAAPDMLAALKAMRRDGCACAVNEAHQGPCESCAQADAAIAKAEGR